MKTIYIFTQGSVLRRAGKRLVLEKQKQRLFELPIKDVGRILSYGRVEITSQTLDALMTEGKPVYFVKRSGAFKGRLAPAHDSQIELRKAQHTKFSDIEFSMRLARLIVGAKIANMQSVICHIFRNRQGAGQLCIPFRRAINSLVNCGNREEIMGVEGAAAAHYFQIYGKSLPEEFRFSTRSRRPAIDKTNALLNMGYMVVLRELQVIIEANHLDPYLGVLHATLNGRPALALDLLEEFRQPLVDLFIFKILSLSQLQGDDFRRVDEGIQMTDEGLRKFFRLYEEKMGCRDGDNPGLRRVMDAQVGQLKQCLLQQQNYRPFCIELFEE